MRKVAKARLDPFRIFEHASHFHESDHRLRKTVPASKPEQIPLIAHPAMVLSVFASELYLKCLLCAEKDEVPNDHNLQILFNGLMPQTRRALEDLWDAKFENRTERK